MSNRTPPRSGGYKQGKASFVDESLFGSRPPARQSQVETLDKNAGTTGHGNSRSRSFSPVDTSAVTIGRADLERMLKPSSVLTAEDVAAAKRAAEARREELQAVSKARKEKMMRLEEEARKHAPVTETELLKRQANDSTRSKAQAQMLEQKDDVKHMNQMMLYSKCVTIRDAQIEEKKQMMREEEEEQRKLDLMMEIERIKALEQYEAREVQRVDERRRGAKVLEEQIKERERERLRQEELRDMERVTMLREIERLKEEEMQAQIEKKLAGQALMAEVAAANSEQIKRKEVMKEREREEDHKIAEYIQNKQLREQALAAEKERVAKEKELETARMRAMQERAADKQSELDELRARRYQESKERDWRAKERAQAERASAMQSELAKARAAQQQSKVLLRSEMAKMEHEEFLRLLDVNKQKEATDMHQTVTAMTLNSKYKEDLLAQIQANEEKRRRDRQSYLEEGARLREAADRERALLLTIKDKKLRDLEGAGVPGKYRAELERMKI